MSIANDDVDDKGTGFGLQQEQHRGAQPAELQQGRRLLQRFLTDGLPPAPKHGGDLAESNGNGPKLVSCVQRRVLL